MPILIFPCISHTNVQSAQVIYDLIDDLSPLKKSFCADV